jgi:hypothetical protein
MEKTHAFCTGVRIPWRAGYQRLSITYLLSTANLTLRVYLNELLAKEGQISRIYKPIR